MKKVAIVVGARPNFIKLFPLIKALNSGGKRPFEYDLIHTGQHYDYMLSGAFFDDLDIPKPDVYLNVAEAQHTVTLANTIRAFDNYLKKNRVDRVIVFGDVNSTVACAVAASHNGVPVIHIEAGLRSFDRTMPEEINRTITDHISSQLFCSEQSAVENLRAEGIEEEVYLVGNIMIDTLLYFKAKALKRRTQDKFGLKKSEYLLITIHRQENIDNPHRLKKILSLLNKLSNEYQIVFPIHPRTQKNIQKLKFNKFIKNLNIIEPQGYLDFLCLQMNSLGVITDSGGVQEETTALNKPCVTIRTSTERPVTVEKGTNILLDIEAINIVEAIDAHMTKKFSNVIIPYWDGKVADRILRLINI